MGLWEGREDERTEPPDLFLFNFFLGGWVKHNKAVQHKNDMAHVGGERGTSSGKKGKRKANEKQFKLYDVKLKATLIRDKENEIHAVAVATCRNVLAN